MKPALQEHYEKIVLPELMRKFGFKNRLEVPRIEKIVLNSGVSSALEKSVMNDTAKDLGTISGQKAVITRARVSVSNFKLRKGMPVGCKVTLRGARMYDFLYRLIVVALPAIRDFRGVSRKFDGQGNYSLGIDDITIFPEITLESVKRHYGLDVCIVTTANNDEEGRELLGLMGMPFRRTESSAQTTAA